MKLQVPVTKGKGVIEVDTEIDIPDSVYAEVVLQGLKVLLNRGMSKVTKETYPDEAEMKAAAMEVAVKQLELVKTGKVKLTGQKSAAKASGAVMTEARRLARNLVKDELKRQKIKVSHVEASEITKAANELLASDPSIIETAKANLEERAKVPIKIDVTAIPISDKLVAAANARKTKSGLSAKQAGKVKPRARAEQATTH